MSGPIVVTGGRGQLGSFVVAGLADLGHAVVSLDFAGCQPGKDGRTWQIWIDLANPDTELLVNSAASIAAEWGTLAGLVCLHGLDSPPTAGATDPWRDWQRFLDVNLTGTLNACRVFGEAMAERGGGSIVTVASLYGLVAPDQALYADGFTKAAGYAASKAGVVGLTRYLAALWGSRGVRVNCIAPGGVRTPSTPLDFAERYEERVPLGRMAEPGDVLGAVLWLLSDQSRYVTGQVLAIDGGYTVW